MGNLPSASVAGIGDVNGDGLDDIAVGIPEGAAADIDRASPGLAVIVYGRREWPERIDALAPASQVVIVAGEQENGRFGEVVAGLGDVNHDGYADLAVLASSYLQASDGFSTPGRGYVVFGGSGLPAVVDTSQMGAAGIVIHSTQGIASISTAGDFNGDGVDDLVFGEVFHEVANPDGSGFPLLVGRGVVMAGRETWPEVIDTNELPPGSLAVTGSRDFEQTGDAVAALGDMDGDGLNDVGVTQTEAMRGSTGVFVGRAFVVYGRSEMNLELVGESAPGNITVIELGQSGSLADAAGAIHGGQDMNRDGLSDFLIGFPDSGEGNAVRTGAVAIVEGRSQRPLLIDLGARDVSGVRFVLGDAAEGRFGTTVRMAPDLSGGGSPDFLVAAPIAEGVAPFSEEGRLYLVSGERMAGQTAPALTVARSFEGTRESERFGLAMDIAGDVNGDGHADIVVAAVPYRGDEPGLVYLLLRDEDSGDLNGDLLRDASDLLLFAESWQRPPDAGSLRARADADASGTVDAADLRLMVGEH